MSESRVNTAAARDTGDKTKASGNGRASWFEALAGRFNVELGISVGVVLFILFVWWAIRHFNVLSYMGISANPDLFVPAIEQVWNRFLDLSHGSGYRGRNVWEHLGWSMLRMLVGVGAAIVLGMIVGVAMGVATRLKAVFDPILEFYRPLPPLGYYTLLIVWFGIGETPKVLLLFLAAFAPVAIGTESVSAMFARAGSIRR